MKLTILGSTGSIGKQTLEVAEVLGLQVASLTAHANIDLLEAQIGRFRPALAVVYDTQAAQELKKRCGGIVEVAVGMEGLKQAAAIPEADIVVNALVGNVGLLPTIAALNANKPIALANKEVLVTAGEIVMPLARSKGLDIMPIDSEHSAILQCIKGENAPCTKIYLTASGGPFRGKTLDEMKNVTCEEALAHPNWSMGPKISIDSATMMNKGLEVIEAHWLFNIPAEQIEVIIHPQSIIHSMVEFIDGQVIAQLGPTDMRLPIQYALTHPNRSPNSFSRLNFAQSGTLTFEKPDLTNFPCLRLAFDALKKGGLYPTILNAANETAVKAFLSKKISFTDIPRIIENALSAYNEKNIQVSTDAILETEKWVAEWVNTAI
jgi:1-deoxy-D-xylulose-5-phosphate reductoisomerase